MGRTVVARRAAFDRLIGSALKELPPGHPHVEQGIRDVIELYVTGSHTAEARERCLAAIAGLLDFIPVEEPRQTRVIISTAVDYLRASLDRFDAVDLDMPPETYHAVLASLSEASHLLHQPPQQPAD